MLTTTAIILAMNTLPLCPGTNVYSNECEIFKAEAPTVQMDNVNRISCPDGWSLVIAADTVAQYSGYFCAKDLRRTNQE